MIDENEEVGQGLNIPGKVVDGDHRYKEMVRVNAFMGGVLATNGRAIACKTLVGSVMFAPFSSVTRVFLQRKREAAILVRWEEKSD